MFAFLLPYVCAFTYVCAKVYIHMYKRLNTDSGTGRYTSLFKYLKIRTLTIAKTKNRTLQIKIAERANPSTRKRNGSLQTDELATFITEISRKKSLT